MSAEVTLPIAVDGTAGYRRPMHLYASSGSPELVMVELPDVGKADSQAWFWSESWQAGERRVDDLIARGEVEEFDDMEEFLTSLGLNA